MRNKNDAERLANRLPTLFEAREQAARLKFLQENSHWESAEVTKFLRSRERETRATVSHARNLVQLRDTNERELAKYLASAAEHRAAGDEGLARQYEARAHTNRANLARIAREDALRRKRLAAEEEAALQGGRATTAITRVLNAKAAAANRAIMEQCSRAQLRAAGAGAAAEEDEDNPYARRRTVPQNLWASQGGEQPPPAAAAQLPAPPAGEVNLTDLFGEDEEAPEAEEEADGGGDGENVDEEGEAEGEAANS